MLHTPRLQTIKWGSELVNGCLVWVNETYSEIQIYYEEHSIFCKIDAKRDFLSEELWKQLTVITVNA